MILHKKFKEMQSSLLIFALVSTASAGISFISANGMEGSENVGGNADSHHSRQIQSKSRNRSMYGMCPPNFQNIGIECYSLQQVESSWLEAHFFCRDRSAKLAEPQKYSDRKLRQFLQYHDKQIGSNNPIWIGASFDWQSHVWQWSISGANLSYNAFDSSIRNTNLENHCAVYDPNVGYRWSAKSCPDKYRFICQHKMPKVNAENRYKIYNRWNQTYPNQLANEAVLHVVDRKGRNGNRINRRVKAAGSSEEVMTSSRPHNLRNPRPQHFDEISSLSPALQLLQEQHTSKPGNNNFVSIGQTLTLSDRKLARQRQRELARRHKRLRQERLQRQRERIRQREKSNNKIRIHDAGNLMTTEHSNPKQQENLRKLKYDAEERKRLPNDMGNLKKHESLSQQDEQLKRQRQGERERKVYGEQERKRLADKQNRLRLEEEEKERQRRIKQELEEEERRLQMKRLEEVKHFEQKELERVHAENKHREELQRKREEEISRHETERRQLEEDEQRLRKELEEEERRLHEQREIEIRRVEEETKLREEANEREKMEKERQRLERLNELKRKEDGRLRQDNEERKRNYAQRISKLSEADRRAFFEMRKRRKMEKEQKKQLKPKP